MEVELVDIEIKVWWVKTNEFIRANYFGYIKDDKIHGPGIITTPDKNVFVGDFSEGKLKGYTKIFYSNGDVYSGQWKDS